MLPAKSDGMSNQETLSIKTNARLIYKHLPCENLTDLAMLVHTFSKCTANRLRLSTACS